VEFILPPESLSLTCPYCGAVYVTETAESHEIMPPHALIPFAISAYEAKKALRSWFIKHQIEHPRVAPFVGIYLPVWTFDVGGEVRWNGLVERGDDWVPINGNHLAFYDDVLVPGSSKLPDNLVHGFEEFDLSQIVAYAARYLADWPAERYTQPLADASLIARKIVLKDLRKNSAKLTRGEYVRNLRLNSQGLTVESFKLLLLPVWVIHYKLEGDVFDVVINGQTGIVHGERPLRGIRKFWERLTGN
jgi:hypothetical protein